MNKEDDWKSHKNRVLILALQQGSMAKNLLEFANALSLDGFNVTVLAGYDLPLKENANLRKYSLHLSTEELFSGDFDKASENETIKILYVRR